MIQPHSIVFFDGVCNLCNGFVQFVLKHEAKIDFQFCSLQSDFAVKFFKDNQFNLIGIDSVIVFENNQFFIKSEAAFKIISKLKWPYKAFNVFIVLPKFFNDFIYQLVAKFRYKIFGKTNFCWVSNVGFNERFI